MRKINICFFIGSLETGGAEDHVLRTLENLDRSRFNPTLAVFRKEGHWVEEAEKLGVKIVEFRYERYRYLFFKQLIPYIRFLKKNKIDIVHAHLVGSSVFSLLGAYLARVPVKIFTIQNDYWSPYEHMAFFSRCSLRLSVKLADKIVAIAEKLKTNCIKKYHLKTSKIITIYNGVSIKKKGKTKSTGLRKQFKIPKSTVIFGTIAYLTPQKGYKYLIAAINETVNDKKDVKFLIVGSGPLQNELEEQVKKLKLNDYVIFTGFVEDINPLLDDLDVFVMSSLWEGFCMALLRAMAASKPVIATDVGGNSEAIANGKTGFIVKPKDTKELAEKIVLLAKDRNLREKMGKEGKKRFEDQFTAQETTRKLEKLYKELIQNKGLI